MFADRTLWAILGIRVLGLVVAVLPMASVRYMDGYPWGMPEWIVIGAAILVGLVIDLLVRDTLLTYFGLDDDDEDGDDPGEDPDDPIDTPDFSKDRDLERTR